LVRRSSRNTNPKVHCSHKNLLRTLCDAVTFDADDVLRYQVKSNQEDTSLE